MKYLPAIVNSMVLSQETRVVFSKDEVGKKEDISLASPTNICAYHQGKKKSDDVIRIKNKIS